MDEITTKQEQWLQDLQSLSKRPLRVSKSINGKPTKWISLQDAELPADYRTVLHNEIVIDIDSERWKEVRLFAEITCDTLDKLRIPYKEAYSGGRGIHIHVFFDLSPEQKKTCVKNDVMPKDLRVWLFGHILENAGISSKLIGPGKPFDTSCVSWSDEGKGHLIRVFGGKKQWFKTLLSEIPEERPRSEEVLFPGDIVSWHISDQLFQEFVDWFRKFRKERVETIQRYQKASENFTGQYMSLPCIQKILRGLPEGQRNAGARILAIGYRLDEIPKEGAEKAMLVYSGNCSKENISESEYQGWIDWIYHEDNLFWNCRFCKELELCEKQNCTLHESAFAGEHQFLRSKNLIQNISKILDRRIKKEKENKIIVLFVYLSAYGSSPLNLFLKGESSTGKTYLAKSVAEYFPEEDVWFIGDMSPKALIHEHGTFEEGKMHVSLQNKILVFLETPRKETLEMLKPILSHDRREIEYKITDRSRSGALQTKNVIIEGWPATIFCSTDFRVLDELSTRSLLTTPEISEEKIEKVLEYKGIKYSRPWEQMEEDESEVIFRNALKLLKSEREVCVPYADELAQRYTRSEPRVMRDFDKLMELIKMSAFLHQEQRSAFELKINGVSTHFIVANECDYKIGMHLFDHIRETTVTGLPQTIIDFYERIICQLNDITYSSMMKKFKSVYGKLIGRDQIRKRYVDPLEAVGWLNRGKDAVDGRIVTFEKCIDEDENPGKTRLSTSLVLKDIFPEDRLKEYLEEVEKKCVKNTDCNTDTLDTDEQLEPGRNCEWFYCDENLAYFLEQEERSKGGLDEETEVENKSRTKSYNLDEKNPECVPFLEDLIDQYDEETVLLQIPQEDTKVEDVVKKFKDQNKVVDTLVILRDQAKVIAGVSDGHAYIRRLKASGIGNHNAETGLNRWTCSMCGIKFHAQIPYEDYDGNAICGDCWEKLTES